MSIPPHLCTDGLPKSKRLWSEKEHFNCKMVLASIKEKSTVSDRSRINPLGTHIAKKSIPFKAISKIFKKEMIATKFTTHKSWSVVISLPLVTPKRTAKNNCLKKKSVHSLPLFEQMHAPNLHHRLRQCYICSNNWQLHLRPPDMTHIFTFDM